MLLRAPTKLLHSQGGVRKRRGVAGVDLTFQPVSEEGLQCEAKGARCNPKNEAL
jgi:hypothetical protein